MLRRATFLINQSLPYLKKNVFKTNLLNLKKPNNFVQNYAVQQRCYSMIEKMGQVKPPGQLKKSEVEERVMKAIKHWDRFPSDRDDKLTIDARFVEDLGFDSLDHVEIIMSLEDEFGFEFPDTDTENLKSPQDIVKYICKREDVYE